MLWKGRRGSENFIDLGGKSAGSGRKSTGGIAGFLVLGLIIYIMGGDPRIIFSLLESSLDQSVIMQDGRAYESSPEDQDYKEFLSVVLADLEATWDNVFAANGKTYSKPKLIVYRNSVDTQCGLGQAQSGPFYCPTDKSIYIDLSFFHDLKKLGAPGDFAMAYVVGHEFGHHIQNELGTMGLIQNARINSHTRNIRQRQVQLELQADCYSGIWAYHADKQKGFLEEGDIDEGLLAASAVGDDHLQKRSGRQISPESFTHGSSSDRKSWFLNGLKSGSLEACDTFS